MSGQPVFKRYKNVLHRKSEAESRGLPWSRGEFIQRLTKVILYRTMCFQIVAVVCQKGRFPQKVRQNFPSPGLYIDLFRKRTHWDEHDHNIYERLIEPIWWSQSTDLMSSWFLLVPLNFSVLFLVLPCFELYSASVSRWTRRFQSVFNKLCRIVCWRLSHAQGNENKFQRLNATGCPLEGFDECLAITWAHDWRLHDCFPPNTGHWNRTSNYTLFSCKKFLQRWLESELIISTVFWLQRKACAKMIASGLLVWKLVIVLKTMPRRASGKDVKWKCEALASPKNGFSISCNLYVFTCTGNGDRCWRRRPKFYWSLASFTKMSAVFLIEDAAKSFSRSPAEWTEA